MKLANIKTAALMADRLERTKEVRASAWSAAGHYAGTLAAIDAARLKTEIPTSALATEMSNLLVQLLDAECERIARELAALGVEDATPSAA